MSAYKSDQIALNYGGSATVAARPKAGGQLVPEVTIHEGGVEVMSASPDAARALAAALLEAADQAEK